MSNFFVQGHLGTSVLAAGAHPSLLFEVGGNAHIPLHDLLQVLPPAKENEFVAEMEIGEISAVHQLMFLCPDSCGKHMWSTFLIQFIYISITVNSTMHFMMKKTKTPMKKMIQDARGLRLSISLEIRIPHQPMEVLARRLVERKEVFYTCFQGLSAFGQKLVWSHVKLRSLRDGNCAYIDIR